MLGGVPAPPPDASGELGQKEARKRLKREARLKRDAERPPNSFERFRILENVANEGRQVVDLADHKARYALIILGVLNSGVFLVLARSHLISSLPRSTKPWLLGFLVVYAALTFIFVLHAIDCLRPRRFLPKVDELPDRRAPLGLLYWESIAGQDIGQYRQGWTEARMGQINAEAVLIAYGLSRLIRRKYAALGRLYTGLVILVALAMLILIVYAGFSAAA
jgi:hypothetical protein